MRDFRHEDDERDVVQEEAVPHARHEVSIQPGKREETSNHLVSLLMMTASHSNKAGSLTWRRSSSRQMRATVEQHGLKILLFAALTSLLNIRKLQQSKYTPASAVVHGALNQIARVGVSTRHPKAGLCREIRSHVCLQGKAARGARQRELAHSGSLPTLLGKTDSNLQVYTRT